MIDLQQPTPDEVAAMRKAVEARVAEIRAEDERRKARQQEAA